MVARGKSQNAPENGELDRQTGAIITPNGNTELTAFEDEAITRIMDGSGTSEKLPDFQTPDEAMEFLAQRFGGVTSSDDLLGNEYDREDTSEEMKRKLIDVPMVITEYFFSLSDKFMRNGKATGYVNVKAIRLDTMEKIAFSDGSTGIAKQLADHYARTRQPGGILCKTGLRISEYDYTEKDADGNIIEQSPASTFYIA